MQKIMIKTSADAPLGFAIEELPDPQPAADEITIDASYIGIGRIDILRSERKLGARNRQSVISPGLEMTGLVKAVGSEVTDLRPGMAVAAILLADGAYTTVGRVKAQRAIALPAGFDLAAGASIVNPLTAYLVYRDLARATSRDTVVVHGATGGLGSIFAQVGKALLGPATVIIGTVRDAAKHEAALGYGYDEILTDREFTDQVAAGRRFSLICDPVGGELRRTSVTGLAQAGRLVALGNVAEGLVSQVDTTELWFGGKKILGFNLALEVDLDIKHVRTAMQAVLQLVVDGRLDLKPSRQFAFADIAKAFEEFQSGKVFGRIVLIMVNNPADGRHSSATRSVS